MSDKYLTTMSETGVTFKGANYSFMSRVNSSLDELDKWTTPQIDPDLFAYHIMTKKEWTADFESFVKTEDNFGTHISPLADANKKIIRKNAEQAERKLGKPITAMLFSKDLIPFAWKIGTTGRWNYILGSTDNWQELTYTSLADIVNKAHEQKDAVKFLWKIGEVLFSDSSASMLQATAALVTDKYCDKFIPRDIDKEPLSKVSKEGFSFITYFISKYLGQTVTKYNISTQFERLNKVHAIPFVPVNWQPDLETIKSDKLQQIANKFWQTTEKTEETEETKETGEDKILKAMEEIKEQIESSLKGENNTANWLKLSELLDVRFTIALAHELWNDEYMVEIDEGVNTRDIELPEDKILLGVFSWGVLELLIEDNVLDDNDLDKLEAEMEIEYGMAVSILNYSSDKGQSLLESATK